MIQLYLICGFIGSGKTTYSKKLAEEIGALRFSADDWMIPLFGEHMEREVFDQRLNTLKKLFKDSTSQLAKLNVPVIFDFGFWSRTEREAFLSWAEEAGLTCEMRYLDVPFDVCRERAIKRNSNSVDQIYQMTPEMLDLFWSRFEIPANDERVEWVHQ